jgi:ABC-type transport system substrate-binding protein
MTNKFFLIAFLSFVICYLPCLPAGRSFAATAAYDGIWFLGFNLDSPAFLDLQVRQAVAHTIAKTYISNVIMSEEVTPDSIIPPGMSGFDPALVPYKQNITYAKLLMHRAGFEMTDRRLKIMSLLHTDGIKTIEIVNKIKKDLKKIGMDINLVQVSYQDQDKWIKELKSKKHDFFVMGYKADINELFTSEADRADSNSYNLLNPLFRTKGDANFTGFSDPEFDRLLDQINQIDPVMQKMRQGKLKQANRLIYKQLPVIVIFYIEKI